MKMKMLLLASLALSAISTPSWAQNPTDDPQADETDEIVVTAQRRSQALADVPASITVIGSEQIERQRIETLGDYVAKAPNLGFVDAGSSLDRDFTVRGVSNLGGFTRSNAIYVDEFNVTPGDIGSSLEQNLVDVERIEILRGPQGVFFGRNVIGGAVSITSIKPRGTFEAAATAQYARYDSWLLRGMVNAPIGAAIGAIRINGYHSESDGYLRNISTGPDNGYRNHGVRGALRLTPSAAITIDLSAQYNRLRSDNLDAVPTGEYSPTLALLAIPSTIDSGEGFYPRNTRRIATDIPLRTDNRNTQFGARVEVDFGGVSLIGVNGYVRNRARQQGDGDQTALDAYIDDNRASLESYSTEWRLQSDGSGALTWLVGVNFAQDETSFLERRTFATQLPGPFGPIVRGLLPTNRDTTSETKSYGVFANVDLKVGDKLTLSGGARYSHDRVRNYFIGRDFFTGLGTPSEGSVRFDNISPRVSAVYALADRINLYGAVSRGYKPGGFNFSVTQFPNLPRSFGAETAWNYEAGLKGGSADGRFQGSLSAFYLRWSDLQVRARQLISTGPGGFTAVDFVQNAERATSKGIEIEFALRPSERVRFGAAAGYNKATFGNFPNALDFDGLGSTTPNGESRAFDASGNTLPFAPRWTVSVSGEYRHPIGDLTTLYAGADYSHKSLQYQDTTNRRVNALTGARLFRTVIPDYGTLNLNAGLEGERVAVQAFVENLLGHDRYIGARGADGLAGTRVILVPRTVGLRMTARYR